MAALVSHAIPYQPAPDQPLETPLVSPVVGAGSSRSLLGQRANRRGPRRARLAGSQLASGPPASSVAVTPRVGDSAPSEALAGTAAELESMGVRWSPPSVRGVLNGLGRGGAHPGAIRPRCVLDALPLAAHPSLSAVLALWEGAVYECGSTLPAQAGTSLLNQCFYLSLSAAISAQPEGIAYTALRLKRTLEAAVRLVRGEEGVQDDQLGAFADFLEDGMTSHPTLCRRTIAVFDGEQGSVRLIRSPTHWCRDSPVIALLYTPGHYRWIKWPSPGPSTGALIEALAAPPGGLPAVAEIQLDARPPVMINIDP